MSNEDHRSGATERWRLRVGYALSVIVIVFMVMDTTIKLLKLPIVFETIGPMGWGEDKVLALGVTQLACTVLYAIPATSVLGAVLTTGYLGGAVASHLRIDSPLFSHVLFGVYLGVAMWAGLFLRDSRLRALLPFRQTKF